MLYVGAAGVIWALDYLARVGATFRHHDFAASTATLIRRNREEHRTRFYPDAPSYLIGDVGVMLVQWRLGPSQHLEDALFARIETGIHEPVRELMWGVAGRMLTTLSLFDETGDPRWKCLYLRQAERLLETWEADPRFGYLWTQDLYGDRCQYLGPVHGWAGNAVSLLRGLPLLSEAQRTLVSSRISETFLQTAWHEGSWTNWPPVACSQDEVSVPMLVQYCHGAPGMLAALSNLPVDTGSEVDTLMARAGHLIWEAGPLVKGSNLCHGTAGNGYGLLALHGRARDERWLDRARAFAMHGIHQCRRARERYGRGRYSLWTGDLGLAVYLWDCIRAKAAFPTVDVF